MNVDVMLKRKALCGGFWCVRVGVGVRGMLWLLVLGGS